MKNPKQGPGLPFEAATRLQIAVGAALTVGFSVSYMFLWWDRFLGSGADSLWFYLARLVEDGRMPYRDFAIVVPPLHLLQTIFATWLFGNELIAPRLLAILQLGALALILYVSLVRLFPPVPTFLAVFTAVVVSQGDPAIAVSDYVTTSVFWAVAGGGCAAALIAGGGARARNLLSAASGACLGLSFLERQTCGLLATAAVGAVLVALAVPLGFKKAFLRAAAYTAGWCVPVAAVFLWLFRGGALPSFFDQTFLRGPSSKGSLSVVLARPFTSPFTNRWLIEELAASLAALAVIYAVCRIYAAAPRPANRAWHFAALAAAAAAAVGIGALLAADDRILQQLPRLPAAEDIGVFAAFLGTGALSVYYAVRCARRGFSSADGQLWLWLALSFALAYGNGLSWTPFQPMAVPGLAVLLALILSRLGTAPVPRLARYGVLAGCLCSIAAASCLRLSRPFNWISWSEPPVDHATSHSSLPMLRHLDLSPEVAGFVDRVTSDIRANSSAGEPVFTYPYLPLFYVLSDRRPSTFGQVHFIDVLPDFVAERDAETLLNDPPAVLVYMEESESEIRDGERIFRGGGRPGMHHLIAVLQEFRSEYRVADRLVMPGSERPLYVYVRQEPSAAETALSGGLR